ncbi:MAG: NTP transferase domain-containing protein [Thermoguttaceae bacterium]|nr:NTP transferase domain-containing protein [Thermoguttaceae bacterium]
MGSTVRKAIVLAAGKGTRMKSDLPKVLFPVCGKPMINYVLDALDAAKIDEILVVVGYQKDLVRSEIESRKNVKFAEQKELLGTGHAVMSCRDYLEGFDGPVFIIAGDNPMLQSSSVDRLFEEFEKSGASCVLGTVYKENPFGMGRVLRDEQGNFIGVVEEKDATDEQRKIKEINISYYIFNTPDLLASLDSIRNNNAQKEYYITDVPKILLDAGKKILALPVLKEIECLGVNTQADVAEVEKAIQANAQR